MFVVMGLNHLREWIAPGYDHNQPASSDEEKFFNCIYHFPAYKVIQNLCNNSKHLKAFPGQLSVPHSLPIDDWSNIDSVANFDLGPPPGYAVDGHDVCEVIKDVIRFYDEHWFSRQ